MDIRKLVISLAAPFIAAAIGSYATFPNIASWYQYLEKPWFNPPNWMFGSVWTVLYALMGVALYVVWTSRSKKNKKDAYKLFTLQLILNSLWSIVFFGFHELWVGVIVIVVLWVIIALTMASFRRFSRTAMWLLAPYLAWVSFATLLNVSLAVLN